MATLKQVVSARWDGPHLRFVVLQGDRLQPMPLAGAFTWDVTQERTCVGRTQEAQHIACPTEEPVGDFSQCMRCNPLERPDCIFEPRCLQAPEHCDCDFGRRPHVTYIAFYGTLPKVGMTQAWRFETRLREQGADAGFVVQESPNRALARRTEKQVRFLQNIPEHRSHKELLPQLRRVVECDRIRSRAKRLQEQLGQRFDVGELLQIESPLPRPLAGTPHRVDAAGQHAGEWIGAHGRFLLYAGRQRPGQLATGTRPIQALQLGDLVGRWLRDG